MDLSDKWMFKIGLQRHVKIAMDKAIAHVERNPHLDLADVLKADVKMETQRFITQERLKKQSFDGYNPSTNRWMRPDPAGQFNSPYLLMGNNWANRIDPDGGVDDIFLNDDGTVDRVVRNDYPNRFFDSEGTELFFNDTSNTDAHMSWGHFEVGDNVYRPIVNLMEVVVNAGTIRPNVTASNKESYDFIQLGLKSWGSWDFPYVLRKMFDIPNEEMSKAGYNIGGDASEYFRFGKHNTLYNIYDAGQFVWGRAVGHSGFSLEDGLWGADLNEKIFSLGQLGDTAADTQAITNGFHFKYHNQKVRGWD